jgi:alkylglycerol monooxygenase
MLNTIALLIPVFLVLVLVEWYISDKRGDERYSTGNTTMNLAIGAIDQVFSLFYFAGLYFVMAYVYRHFRLITIQNSWYEWILAYIAVDFLSYWYHRFSHRVNILWAAHVTHHSSERFNFSNGFRTSFFQGVNRIIFWSILPVFGFSPLVLMITLEISGVYDFLLHTTYVPKLGFLEKILITPSLHRVHHGKNDIYIDKNYGSTFVIWDKIFGTYQEETETVQYGIKSPYVDNNPFRAIGHYYSYLWTAVITTPRWPDKVRVLFMPPEWKPPATVTAKVHSSAMHIYIPSYLRQYAWFQVAYCVVGLITMLVCKNYLSNWEIILYSIIGVTGIANSAMIFNENVGENFSRWEVGRLAFASLFVLTTLVMHAKIYLLIILFFLMISLVLAGSARAHNHNTSWRGN